MDSKRLGSGQSYLNEKGKTMNKLIVFGSVAAFTVYSLDHVYHQSEVITPHEDEFHEVYTRLTPEIHQMATGSMGDDKRAQWVYHFS